MVGETYGFVGAAVVLSLYALMIWRGLRILTMSKNLYGTLIAGGVLAMLMFQVFVNAGMTIGIMPITGVPLPLLSYGGSSVAGDVHRDRPSTVNICAGTHDERVEEPRIGIAMTSAADWAPPNPAHPRTRSRQWAPADPRDVFSPFARRLELSKLALPPRTYPNFPQRTDKN